MGARCGTAGDALDVSSIDTQPICRRHGRDGALSRRARRRRRHHRQPRPRTAHRPPRRPSALERGLLEPSRIVGRLMMGARLLFAATVFGIAGAALAPPLLAHHSAAAYYDITKSVTLTGRIARVDWRNPHVFFYIDAKSPSGAIVTWTLETQSPIALDERSRASQRGRAGGRCRHRRDHAGAALAEPRPHPGPEIQGARLRGHGEHRPHAEAAAIAYAVHARGARIRAPDAVDRRGRLRVPSAGRSHETDPALSSGGGAGGRCGRRQPRWSEPRFAHSSVKIPRPAWPAVSKCCNCGPTSTWWWAPAAISPCRSDRMGSSSSIPVRRPMADAVVAAIAKRADRPIRYVIDTSADADHVGGNERLSKAGETLFNLDNNPLPRPR